LKAIPELVSNEARKKERDVAFTATIERTLNLLANDEASERTRGKAQRDQPIGAPGSEADIKAGVARARAKRSVFILPS
jgi:hypothetical protein